MQFSVDLLFQFSVDPLYSLIDFFQMGFSFFLNPWLRFIKFNSFLINERKYFNSFIISRFSIFVFVGSVDDRRIQVLNGLEMFLEISFFSSPSILIQPFKFLKDLRPLGNDQGCISEAPMPKVYTTWFTR